MQALKPKLYIFLILFFSVLMLTSCSLERKIANNYVKASSGKSVLLYFPDQLIKTNLKNSVLIDSIKVTTVPDTTLFLQKIEDSLFIGECKKSMVNELKAYGFKVYLPDQIDELVKNPDSIYVLNLAQMQVEEYVHTEEVGDSFDDLGYYSSDINLNAINLNSWFELSRSRVPDEKYPVLYSSYYIYDDLEGSFYRDYFLGRINYRYKIDTITMDDINNLADLAGKSYATNFYDYLLNMYIQDHLPANQAPLYYFHYDRKRKMILNYYEDSFIEMDPNN